jgi:hypothetical protein
MRLKAGSAVVQPYRLMTLGGGIGLVTSLCALCRLRSAVGASCRWSLRVGCLGSGEGGSYRPCPDWLDSVALPP